MNETAESTAQSFDVGAFLNTLVSTGAAVATSKIQASQNNGQPATTTTPNLKAAANGNAVPVTGLSASTITMLAVGGAAVLVAVLLLRK